MKEQTVDTNNGFAVPAFLAFLDSVMADCTPPKCLSAPDKARIRRAKATYTEERAALVRTLHSLPAEQQQVAIPYEVYDKCWETLCKRQKYGILSCDYSVETAPQRDLRYPRDARQAPSYAKATLSELRTLQAIATAHWKQQGFLH